MEVENNKSQKLYTLTISNNKEVSSYRFQTCGTYAQALEFIPKVYRQVKQTNSFSLFDLQIWMAKLQKIQVTAFDYQTNICEILKKERIMNDLLKKSFDEGARNSKYLNSLNKSGKIQRIIPISGV